MRRFARAQSLDELLVKTVKRNSILDAYKPYLHRRWNEGCDDIARLYREVREQGFTGDIQCIRRYFRPFKKPHSPRPRQPPAPAPEPRPAPKPRRIVRWIMTNPGHLADADAAELKEIRAACPHLDAVTRHVRDFADMMRDLHGDQLPAWMERVTEDELPALHSLINGLRRDLDAVTAALSSPWSSGQVEGHVTRVKLLKRMGSAVPTSICSADAYCTAIEHPVTNLRAAGPVSREPIWRRSTLASRPLWTALK